MASISNDNNGRKRILFMAGDGNRKTIRLGKASSKQAEAFKVKIESLVSASITNNMDDETSRWLVTLDDKIHARLAATGLIKARQSATLLMLAPYLDAYIAGRTDVKKSTTIRMKQARKELVEYFGETKSLREITEGDADEFQRHLKGRPTHRLSDNTARRFCGLAKQFFRPAVRKHILAVNPFADLKTHVQGTTHRDFFITRDMAQKVLDKCPDLQWKLIFALSRFGGLRCPSEHMMLRWSDVDFDNGRITIHSPKTEHVEGKESRMIPIFPELESLLHQAFAEAPPGDGFVITRYRSTTGNLRTQLQRIVKRAGLEAWPKLFHNLRATRQNELAEQFPAHVVCAWIGNSEAIARRHYLRVQDEHFKKAAQNPAQQPAESVRNDSQAPTVNAESRVKTQDSTDPMGRKGLEYRSKLPENPAVWGAGGAESVAPQD